MENSDMESVVNCPSCSEQLRVILKPRVPDEMYQLVGKMIGIEKTDRFEGESNCKCGKHIVAVLIITAEDFHGNKE